MFHSKFQIFNFCIFDHPMIYQICDVMIILVLEAEYIFEYVFWTKTH